MSSLKDRRRRGTEHAFTASGLDKTGDIVAQINAPKPVESNPKPSDKEEEPLIEAATSLVVQEQVEAPVMNESVAEKVMRKLASPRKHATGLADTASNETTRDVTKELDQDVILETKPEDEAEDRAEVVVSFEKDLPSNAGESFTETVIDDPNADTQEPIAKDSLSMHVVAAPTQFPEAVATEAENQVEEATQEALVAGSSQEPESLAIETNPTSKDAKPALSTWEKLAAINATAKRHAPSSRRYIAHVPAELFDACRVLRGDWPITTWFVSLVAKYHDGVVKELVGTTPDASLGVVPRRVYRKQEGNTKCFLLYFANTELGLAQQAFFEECLSSAGTTTEYVVAVLQSHADANRTTS